MKRTFNAYTIDGFISRIKEQVKSRPVIREWEQVPEKKRNWLDPYAKTGIEEAFGIEIGSYRYRFDSNNDVNVLSDFANDIKAHGLVGVKKLEQMGEKVDTANHMKEPRMHLYVYRKIN